MADINDYQGNANLAYGSSETGAGPIGAYKFTDTLDSWQRLSAYTFTADRDKWMEANRQKDILAMEAGKLLPFNYGDMMENDRQQIDAAVQEYTQYFTENPTAVRLEIDPNGKIKNAKEHAEMYKKRQQIDQLITRANVRKTQDAALQKQIAGLPDPTMRAEAEAWWQTEKATPISNDLRLYPAFKPFDTKEFFNSIAGGEIKFDEMQRNPNDIVTTQTTLSNFNKSLGLFHTRYLTDPTVRMNLDKMHNEINALSQKYKDPTSGKIDIERFKREHPHIFTMNDAANGFLKTYNGAVDKGVVKLGKIEPINIEDGITLDEMAKLMISSQATYSTEKKITETDDANDAARLAIAREGNAIERGRLALAAKDMEERNDFSGGEIGNRAWWLLGKEAQSAPGGKLVTDQLVQNAFSINTGKKEKKVVKNEDGTETVTEELPITQAPKSVKVYASKDGNPNNFRVVAAYDDPTAATVKDKNGNIISKGTIYKEFSAAQAYDKMSYIGDPKKVDVFSKMNTKFRMSPEGINSKNVDFNKFDQFFSSQSQQQQQTQSAAPAAAAPDTKGTYIWNGREYTYDELTRRYTEAQLKELIKKNVFKKK